MVWVDADGGQRSSNYGLTSRPSNLLGDIDEGGGGQLGEGVQGDDHHGGGGVGVDQLLQQLSAARSQAGVVMHVLQHGDQLQLQVHWGGQTYTVHRRLSTHGASRPTPCTEGLVHITWCSQTYTVKA